MPLGAAEVGVELLSSLLELTVADLSAEREVGGHVRLVEPSGVGDDQEGQAHLGHQVLHRLVDAVVAGETGQGEMGLGVGRARGAPVAGRRGPLPGLRGLLHGVDEFDGDVGTGGLAHGTDLHGASQPAHVGELVAAEPTDEHPAMGLMFDEAFLGKTVQRLADGASRDLERIDQAFLRELRPRLQFTGEDLAGGTTSSDTSRIGQVRHLEQGRNVPMYRTSRPCRSPVDLRGNEIPVFWACGVTPQAAVMASRPPLAICHAPGHMAIMDRLDTELVVP